MLPGAHTVDPWTRTIDLLSVAEGSQFAVVEPADCGRRHTLTEKFAPKWRPFVRVVDRPSPLTVALDWRDSTTCCYREQLWVAGRARVSGRCAMSGALIVPGDEIFRPRPARPTPRNVSAMVLAAAVDAYMASELLTAQGASQRASFCADDNLVSSGEARV